MKKQFIHTVLSLLTATILLYTACTKETGNTRLDPKLSTSQVLDILSDSATVVGFVISTGDGFTERGICYDVAPSPTTDKSKVVFDGTITGATFKVRFGGLAYATKYYARAYAVSAGSTIYGDEVNFTTLPVVPTLTTAAVTSIAGTTATGGGEVTVTGGATVTERGICFGTAHNPTTSDSKVVSGAGAGTFTANMAGLNGLTTYYVRAYAINSAGTGYGPEESFTTLVSVRTWNIAGDYVEASYPGTTLANWSPDKSPQIASTASSPDNVEGYVYMAGVSNQWKIATKLNWDGPNYGKNATAGQLDPAGDNIPASAGYYKINVNAGVNPMTYTAVATNWGVIGSASPNGWSDETALSYDPSTRTWNGGIHLTTGTGTDEFKFRANHSWDYNYGAPAGKDTLNAGGDNIKNTFEADYAFTLDLSHPNKYTFSFHRWGVIGSATAGGWGSDQNMTWDGANGVFKVLLTLTASAGANEIKFRADDDWTINLGGSLGALTQGGDNITVATAGDYSITLNPWTKVATMTLIVK